MDEILVTGTGFMTDIRSQQEEDKSWKFVVKMVETLYYSDGTSKSETIDAMCIDNNYDTAYEVSLRSALIQLREETQDKGISSLVESRQLARKLEELNDSSKANTDTPS